MAYPKTNWVNDVTPANQTNMNKIEQGIYDNSVAVENLQAGWNSINATLTYSSADAPTFVVGTNIDLTGTLSVGMKLKLTQTTDKYFFITAIDSTTITLYGGTDYVLANATITNPAFSTEKAPYGFPLDPDKWSVVVTDTTFRPQPSPTSGTWYNIGNIFIDIPIGLFMVKYSGTLSCVRASAGALEMYATLSTTNNGASDNEFTRGAMTSSVVQLGPSSLPPAEKMLDIVSKTRYYYNVKVQQTSITSVNEANSLQTLVIKATIAYL